MTINWQKKVRPGDPLRIGATAYNKFVDAAVWVDRRGQRGAPPKTTISSGHVLVRNEGNTDLPAFTPYRIDGVDSTCLVRRDPKVVFEISTGSGSSPLRRNAFAVTQEPIRRKTIGVAAISGFTYAKVIDSPGGTVWAVGMTLGLGIGALRPESGGSAVVCGSGWPAGDGVSYYPVNLGVPSGAFFAKIRANPEQIGSAARWRYGFDEVTLDNANTAWDNEPLGRRTDWLGTALNTYEAANTASSAYSIPVAGDDFAIGNTGVRFRPVPSGTIVRMHLVQASDPQLVAVFSAPNPVWGPCNAFGELVTSGSFGTSNELTSDESEVDE